MDIIIGAGITGLGYALFCGHSEYMLIEAEKSVGGYCRTIKRNGFVWDYSGHFFHFRNPYIKEIIMSAITEEDLLFCIKNTKIKYKDRYVDYPFQKNIHQLPKEELLECLYDLFTTNTDAYTTFQEMLYAKFGKSIADKFLIPYNTKLYACNLDSLDKDAMGRFFPYAEKEDIIRNFKSKTNISYNDKFIYPKGGAIEYVNSILNKLDTDKIHTETRVISVSKEDKLVTLSNGESYHYDNLISTVPFPNLLRLISSDYDLSSYSWNQVLVFNLGFDKKGVNVEEHWVYYPENKYCFYRVGFYDNIMCQDRMSLYVEIGFHKDDSIRPSEWLGRVMSDLKEAGVVSSDQVLLDYEAIIMNPAYVHITDSSIKEVERIKKELAGYNIYSIGRYGSWTYCSIEDNIKEALDLSNKIYK